MPRTPRVSPDRILATAALEFAAHGFAGARVDRIARLADVNKAMLYYHFGSKQALYRALLRRTFLAASARLRAIHDTTAPPAQQIEMAIAAMAGFVAEHSFFPAIMLREVAEGGAHLDHETLAALASVPAAVGDIVRQGVAQKSLRSVHPMVAYFAMFAPIVVYMAGERIRLQLADTHLHDAAALPSELFITQLQEAIRLAFAVPVVPDFA